MTDPTIHVLDDAAPAGCRPDELYEWVCGPGQRLMQGSKDIFLGSVTHEADWLRLVVDNWVVAYPAALPSARWVLCVLRWVVVRRWAMTEVSVRDLGNHGGDVLDTVMRGESVTVSASGCDCNPAPTTFLVWGCRRSADT